MTKRPRSWDSDVGRQTKFVVNEVMVNSKHPDYMKMVYDKTYDLLFKGAQRPLEPMAPPAADDTESQSDEDGINMDKEWSVSNRTKDPLESARPAGDGNTKVVNSDEGSNTSKKYCQLRIDKMIWGDDPEKGGNGTCPRG